VGVVDIFGDCRVTRVNSTHPLVSVNTTLHSIMKVSSGHRRPVCSCAAFGDVRPHHSQPHVTASIKTGHRSFFSIRPPHVRTRQHHPPCVVTRPRPRAASLIRRAGGLSLLGQDVLYFLGATVAVIPVFKKLNISPVLGFLASGVLLHQLGCVNLPSMMHFS